MEALWARLYGMSFVDLLVCSRMRPMFHGQGVVTYGDAVENSTDSSAETAEIAEIAAELLRMLRLLRVLLRVLHRLLLRLLDH